MKRKSKDLVYNWDEVPAIIDIPYAMMLLGCSRETIRRECQNGGLPAFKVGDMWRIRKDALEAYTKGKKLD